MTKRTESDYLGKVILPKNAYYGAQTQRALTNYQISGIHFQQDLIYSLTLIKRVAAQANAQEKKLEKKKASVIRKACDEILAGKFNEEFSLDIYQAGAGTSQNMNVNEVIANRANELLGAKKGSYKHIHPNDHVNMSQSTNDTFHSSMHIASYTKIQQELLPKLAALEKTFQKKSRAFSSLLKTGRTHLKDAIPLTLGQEFSGYTRALQEARKEIDHAAKGLLYLNIGGTAIGTGLNASKTYQRRVIKQLQKDTGFRFRPAPNLFEATQGTLHISIVSNALKTLCLELIKIANDLRLLDSGPTTGLGEITLPAVQPGSSIMPGKVNPSVPEMLTMVCFQVIGNDTTISMSTQASQLELNPMMPLIAYNIVHSITILSNAIKTFDKLCVAKIAANPKRMKELLEKNPIAVTVLSPHIGYSKAAEVAKIAYKENKSIRTVVLELKLLPPKKLDKILDYKKMVKRK